MPFRDHKMGWNRRRLFISAIEMNGMWMESSGTLTSQGAGAAVFSALGVAASELTGIAIGAAGDEIYSFLPIPWDMDTDKDVWARVWFAHDATDADTPVWKVFWKWIKKQEAISDAASSGDAAVTFDAHTCSTTTGSLEVTDWAKLSLTLAESADVGIQLSVECDNLGSASANEIKFLGLELAYTVSMTGDNPNHRDTTDFDPED